MLEKINQYIWNAGLLTLLLGTGFLVTLKTGFFQIRGISRVWKGTFGAGNKDSKKLNSCKNGTLSQFKVFTASLSAAMGTGNIVGVASALAVGGAGSIFWMWISALFGMMLTYAENILAVKYRKPLSDGGYSGGPMAYLEYGLKCKPLAIIYAVFCLLASLGMGNMTQSSAASHTIYQAFKIPTIVTGLVIACVLAFTILGGIQKIGSLTQILLPVLAGGYMLSALLVIIFNISALPDAFNMIFKEAFGIRAVGGGTLGTVISVGLRHGVFSNEAGLGSSALIHSNASDDNPYTQGLWSMTEVFLDTIICCTLTALAILTSGVSLSEPDSLTIAFSTVFGEYSSGLLSVMTALFAFCTLLGWCFCGEQAVRYLGGKRAVFPYRIIFCISACVGAVIKLQSVWTLSDIANGLMAIPNLLGILLLLRKVRTPDKLDI